METNDTDKKGEPFHNPWKGSGFNDRTNDNLLKIARGRPVDIKGDEAKELLRALYGVFKKDLD